MRRSAQAARIRPEPDRTNDETQTRPPPSRRRAGDAPSSRCRPEEGTARGVQRIEVNAEVAQHGVTGFVFLCAEGPLLAESGRISEPPEPLFLVEASAFPLVLKGVPAFAGTTIRCSG